MVQAFADMQFDLLVERAAKAEKEVFFPGLKELIEKLEGQVQEYRRTKFGVKSERLNPAQMELVLEDLEAAIAETQTRIAAVKKGSRPAPSAPAKQLLRVRNEEPVRRRQVCRVSACD